MCNNKYKKIQTTQVKNSAPRYTARRIISLSIKKFHRELMWQKGILNGIKMEKCMYIQCIQTRLWHFS